MKCSEVEFLISAYADNELQDNEKENVSNHLASCEACRLFYDFEMSSKRAVASLPITKAPLGLKARILSEISGEPAASKYSEVKTQEKKTIFFPWRMLRQQNMAFATAAGIMIFIGVLFVVIHMYGGGNGMSPFLTSAMAYFDSDKPESKIGTSEEIEKYLEQSIHRDISVPNLDGIGFELLGATNLPNILEKACAALRYKGKSGEVVSHLVICCTDVPIEKLSEVTGRSEYHYASKKGLNMIFWRCDTSKTTRVIASTCSMEKLIVIADDFRSKADEHYQENHLKTN